MSDDQINRMISRFLGWKLPENFSPDAGISFKASYNENTRYPSKHEPTGTNLFNWAQADEMVRYMIASPAMNNNITNRLLELANDDALPDYVTQTFHEAATEIERLCGELKQEQEKFQQETLRTSECAALLRRWIARAGYHKHDNVWRGVPRCEWCTLVGDSEELLATPINLGRTKEPKP